MEMGIGIHGEPGRERMALKSVDEITEMLALSITDSSHSRTVREWDEPKRMGGCGTEDPPFQSGDRVPAFVNSMGGTPFPNFISTVTSRNLSAAGTSDCAKLVGPITLKCNCSIPAQIG